jgi:inosine triphosphate pyrophosphatase
MLSGFADKSGYALCTIGYAEKPGEVKLFHGKTDGMIVDPRGGNGFGWDQCFLPIGYEKTYAEMTRDDKNQISHRHKAVLKLRSYFETLLPSTQNNVSVAGS